MDSLLSTVLDLPNGARFYRVDLHNHTPSDDHFHCAGYPVDTDEQRQVFAGHYVRYLKENQGIEIVGITEHNDVSWLPYIQDAARREGLIVFPGVELGTNDGKRQVHILALFDPHTPADDIDHFMSSLDLVPKKRFHTDGSPRLTACDVPDLIARIVESDGLPIAAHASSKNGLFHEMEGESRILAYTTPYLIAVEIPGQRTMLPDFELRLVNGELENYANKDVACLNHSDGRCVDEPHPDDRPSIGSRFTHVKLSDHSIEALRQAFQDHESRVRLQGEYREEAYPRLLGLVIENGFLSGKPQAGQAAPFMIHFNPNLNAIIGGRGTGKSALLEAIRYVFDLEPRTDDTCKQHRTLVDNTLDADARLTAFYELSDGTQYKITRVKGHPPRVYDVATGEEKQVHPRQILPVGVPVEVYGQKEIFEISKDVAFQLNLLDTYAVERLSDLRQREEELLRWLTSNADDILRLQEEIARAEDQLQQLEGVRLEVERMEKHQATGQLERKKHAEREKALLEQVERGVAVQLEALAEFKQVREVLRDLLPEDIEEELPHADTLESQAALLERIDRLFAKSLDDLRRQINIVWKEGEPEREAWRRDYDRIQQDYEDLLGQLGGDFSAERYFEQRAKLHALQGIEREMERRRQRLESLRDERQKKLYALRRLRRTREFRVRRRTAQRLTDQLQDGQAEEQAEAEEGAVRVTVTLEGDREAYAQRLGEILTGHRIRKTVFEQLATAKLPATKGTPEERRHYPDPIHLAQAIRCERQAPSEEDSLLATIYDVSPAYRERLAMVGDETLYRLEVYRVPDRPDIQLKVGKRYRSLTPPEGQPGLSTGQKCTAILSLILVERSVPLVIDQPEDDLDNEFIFREIVQTLKREKERRQFIIATHNANIPVSGDAELIVVLQADQDHGWIDVKPGSIDDPELRKPVEDILEGGEEAFRIRRQKYETWG